MHVCYTCMYITIVEILMHVYAQVYQINGISSVTSLAFLIVMHIVNEQQYIHGRIISGISMLIGF